MKHIATHTTPSTREHGKSNQFVKFQPAVTPHIIIIQFKRKISESRMLFCKVSRETHEVNDTAAEIGFKKLKKKK